MFFFQELSNLIQTVWEEIQPAQQINMLLGDLGWIIHSRVIVKSTSHEIAFTALVLALPSIESFWSFNKLGVFKTLMWLSVLEIPIPLFQFSIVIEHEPDNTGFFGCWVTSLGRFLHQSQERQKKGGWIHLKPILENKPWIWHHWSNIPSSDLFPADPPEDVHFVHPVGQHIHHQNVIIVDDDTLMESVIPEERTWEY